MNFDDYATQMTLKYQIAIATAVIKNKPINLTIEQYINRLNIIDKMDFESDITTCGDDFKFDDEDDVLNDSQITNASVNLLEGINIDLMEEVKTTNLSNNNNQINYKINNEDTTQSTFCEEIISQNILDGNGLILLNLSQHNIENEQINNKKNNELPNNFNKEIINVINTESIPFDSQQTSLNNNMSTNKQSDIKQCTIPSINNTQVTQNNNINNSNKLIGNTQIQFDSQQTELYSFQFNNIPKMLEFKDTNISNKQDNLNLEKYNKITFDTQQTHSNNSKKENINITKINNVEESKTNIIKKSIIADNLFNTQQTQMTQDNENYSYISQSQSQFIEIQRNQLYKAKDKQTNMENNKIDVPIYENAGRIKNIPHQSSQFLDKENFDFMPFNIERNKQMQNDEEMYEINSIDNIEFQNSQFEIVPFKIIDELNRLKIYLERKNKETDGSLSDSGYKSDSQSRSSFISHQQTQDTLVNHSAKTVLDFILNSPLVLAAKEIVNEISWVLGRLIDKLYIEEKYFLFLEEVLSSIDNLLKDIYEGESFDEDVIMKKDDKINRLFLINRSNHILKYTIEKITIILEKYLLQINDLLEINNTKETENLSYILNILEYLLKRYIYNKNKNSQYNTQFTQDEKYLKKSSISDIWRRKWNPSKTVANSIVDKKCIEIKCMEVLNKIIVKSMEGYSLISFSALQCFNLLQN